jgi:hypothetical protein
VGCYNDDVLFVHIPKCGGTAVKAYMAENLPGVKWPRPATWFMARDGRLEVTEADRKAAHQSTLDASLPIGHVPLRDIPRFTGRPLDSWYKIIVTNGCSGASGTPRAITTRTISTQPATRDSTHGWAPLTLTSTSGMSSGSMKANLLHGSHRLRRRVMRVGVAFTRIGWVSTVRSPTTYT